MTIVLVTLLAIAITLVLAGLFLSPKPQAPVQQDLPYATRNGTRVYRSVSSQAYKPEKNVRLQRTARIDTNYRPTKSYKRSLDQYGASFSSSNFAHFRSLLNVKQLISPRDGEPTPWLGICLILIAMFGLGMYSLQPLFAARSNASVISPFWTETSPGATPLATPQTASKSVDTNSPPVFTSAGASQALVRVNQMSASQYNSNDEFNTWSAAACSAASMTEVINAYKHTNYRVTDILKVESGLHQITPELGLLDANGIDATVDKFGFKAFHLQNATLDEIISIANKGRPVIVSYPPPRVEGGHILVLRGGQGNNVYMADSSLLNKAVMTRADFSYYWGGFAVVVTPK
ncbi:C39 family peptidase [Dictyobacter arantiisoli]|uniref:Peptidase C39-like domain-containing protein n=1 Tax=Dictyobacter arantiisoli TaxID=2014874 RepID=A0A5A5T8V9_9CHLR|nr:C39 family peptidase [Dictyobacter arantiisoli]GCF07842.1 hypothetical protein KDI_14060 [Dictyobacter arantiisoli]